MFRDLIPQNIKNLKHLFTSKYYSWKYEHPSRKLKVIGVTGTDGKTTTSNLIYEILKAAGYQVGLISTISAKMGKEEVPTGFHVTTPSPKELQYFLKLMVERGLEYVVLETTSHALDQYRVGGIEYDFAVYTNITHEHLDYHKTYENYLLTKSKLMGLVRKGGIAILNRDDSSYEQLYEIAHKYPVKVLRYGFTSDADLKAEDLNKEKNINHFGVNMSNGRSFDVRMKLLGGYNIYNALAAISVALELGISPEKIVQSLESFQYLEGRWELMQKKPFQVIVDFAHTPNALEKALEVARKQIDSDHDVIVVFGCAGKRDTGKRPMMGEVSARLANKVILTAEDPRGENVEDINRQIMVGMEGSGKRLNKEVFSIPDRGTAIYKALTLAKPGDLVVITGKGHEKSMNIDGVNEMPWSDQEAVRQILSR